MEHQHRTDAAMTASGWQGRVRRYRGWTIRGHEGEQLLSLTIDGDNGFGAMVIDLDTHERITQVHADGSAAYVIACIFRQLAADRDEYDRQRDRPRSPRVAPQGRPPQTWTPLQQMALFTGATWHPPTDSSSSANSRDAARRDFVRVNRAIRLRRLR